MSSQPTQTTRIAPNPFDPLPIAFYVHTDGNLSWSIYHDDLHDRSLFGICAIDVVSFMESDHADHSFIKCGHSLFLVTSTTAERVADALGLTIQAQPVAA